VNSQHINIVTAAARTREKHWIIDGPPPDTNASARAVAEFALAPGGYQLARSGR